MSADQKIDQLYQLPLDEFTAARNALAKETAEGAIKKLEKPNLAAWAVNQLYWHERKLYDEVIKTSTQVRTAHRQMLSGKPNDVKAAETFHGEAMRKAKDAIRRLLEAAGGSAAGAVMTPVTETLDALPTTDTPGRLTRPLRRTGFEALQGITITAKAERPALKSEPKKSAAEKENEKDRRKRESDQQELAMVRERLRFAEAAVREAEASLDRARRSLERTERTRERIDAELAEAVKAEQLSQKELDGSESTYHKAVAERDRLRKKATS
ncbi:MAG: hypothetical protein ABI039_11805 [Vicinamibacterales bacterium]